MTTAILTDGLQYTIPSSDTDFFKQLAKKMGWPVVCKTATQEVESENVSWVDEFIGKWQDSRTTEQILQDIHNARTANDDIIL